MSPYYDQFNTNDKKQMTKTPIWVRLLDIAMFIIAVVTTVSLVICLLSQHVNPSVGWLFPIMGLLAPIIYIVSVMTTLYWIIRWQWRIALPLLIVVVIGTSKVSLIIKVPFEKDYDTTNYSGSIKIMSYNTRWVVDDNGQRSNNEIVNYINEQRPDIICLQETHDRLIFDSINIRNRYNKYVLSELAIYSRYPIVNRGEIFSDNEWESGCSIFADVIIKGDTIRVFNNHLHSTEIKTEDNKYLTSSQIVRDNQRTERIGSIIRRLNSNAVERAKQSDLVVAQIESTPHKMIVCGDFNETPMSYTYNRISNRLLDSFQECGDNYSYTFRGFFNSLRIDYILLSPQIAPMSYYVDREFTVSDHLPIIVRAKIIN